MGKIKKALITGITGQDGSYLAEFLLEKKYKVYGFVRRVALEDETHRLWRIRHIKNKLHLDSASLESYASIVKIIQKIKPDEVYHLAAQSYVSYSFEDEFSTLNTNINGTHYILSAIKEFSPKTKFYFAASSEMFGKVRKTPQNELTPFYPRSSYGISKVAGFELTRNYREAYNIYACSGILFNHESPRRGFEFVTRKISFAVAKIKFGIQKNLYLGNINSKRDWGHAKDYAKAMWLINTQKKSSDYIIGTGRLNSVEDFVKKAFKHVGLNYKKYLKIDKKLFRKKDSKARLANPLKLTRKLKWKREYNFESLVVDMVESELKKFNLK